MMGAGKPASVPVLLSAIYTVYAIPTLFVSVCAGILQCMGQAK